jgi:hypothetical protein
MSNMVAKKPVWPPENSQLWEWSGIAGAGKSAPKNSCLAIGIFQKSCFSADKWA